MSIRIYSKDVDLITPEEDIQLQRLISSGSIYSSLEECRRKDLVHRIFIAKNKKIIVGWSTMVGIKDNLKERLYEFMVYVKKTHRRLGIGRKLYKKSRKYFKLQHSQMKIYATDRINKCFFKNVISSC